MSIISNFLDKYNIPHSLAQADDFAKWLAEDLWNKYKTDRMDKRTLRENDVRNLHLRLPNGQANKAYHTQLCIPKAYADCCSIEVAEELQLTYEVTEDEENWMITISGTPPKHGDFNLTLRYKYHGWIDGEELSALTLPIAFNPDPRSLWKNQPTPKTITFYKPDYDHSYVTVPATADGQPQKDMVAASQRGRSHAHEGKPRDDHFLLHHCAETGWYIMAVADGAGSAKYSRKGSEIACNTVVNYCKDALTGQTEQLEEKVIAYRQQQKEQGATTQEMRDAVYNILGNAALKAHQAINEAAIHYKDKPKDYATTLMFAVCKKFSCGWFVASYWVGDGAICQYDKQQHIIKLLGTPDEGEFSGQTRFLTMPEIFSNRDVMGRLRISIMDDFTALILMTDGVSDPLFETDKNLNSIEKWDEFWDLLQTGFPEDQIGGVHLTDDNSNAQYELLRWLDFWSAGNHDDRTIAILY